MGAITRGIIAYRQWDGMIGLEKGIMLLGESSSVRRLRFSSCRDYSGKWVWEVNFQLPVLDLE